MPRRTGVHMSRLAQRLAVVGTAAVLAVGGLAVPGAAGAPAKSSGKCPLDSLKKAKSKPVEIVFWHAMQRANEETLNRLTDRFNSSQNDVRVKLVNQTTYTD